MPWKRRRDKRYRNYSAADFALDSYFVDWVLNPAFASEEFWSQWVNEHVLQQETIAHARSLVMLMTQFKEEKASESEIGEEWKKQAQRIALESESFISPDISSSRRSRAMLFFYQTAAILLLVSIPFAFYFITKEDTLPIKQTSVIKKTLKGQKLTFLLPDDTEVKLNADSRLIYPSAFNTTARVVALCGEGFFKVAHNKDIPFKVVAHNVTTTALGTAFNVNAYPESPNVEVALVEGRVNVECAVEAGIKGEGVILEPYKMIRISTVDATHQISAFTPEKVIGWKENILHFEKAGFKEIISKLERWYGVEVEIAPGVPAATANYVFTGSFTNRSLEYVMNTLSHPNLFAYKLNKKHLTITTKDENSPPKN